MENTQLENTHYQQQHDRLALLAKDQVIALREAMTKAAAKRTVHTYRLSPAVSRGVATEFMVLFQQEIDRLYGDILPELTAVCDQLAPEELRDITRLLAAFEKTAPDKLDTIFSYFVQNANMGGIERMMQPLLLSAHPAERDVMAVGAEFNKMSLHPKFDLILHTPDSIAHFARKSDCYAFIPDIRAVNGVISEDDNRRHAIAFVTLCAQHYAETYELYFLNECHSPAQTLAAIAAFDKFNNQLEKLCEQLVARCKPKEQLQPTATENVGAAILAFRPRK